MKRIYFGILLLLIFFVDGLGQQFKVSYSSTVFDKPFTGKVVVYMSKDNKEPKNGAVGRERFPCFSVSVKNIKPGQAITIDDNATSFPTALSDIERGTYYVQVVWDRNLGGRSIAKSPGNLFSPSEKLTLTKDTKKIYPITATQMIPAIPEFKETELVKELIVPSALLSTFHGKAMTVNGAVILPDEYFNEPDRSFPVLFTVFGYGGDYNLLSGYTKPILTLDSIPVIKVYLDGNCPLGHTAYANSDNNGPWGDALTTEFIPVLEKTYRCNGARLLFGHSSGGWSVLWLQTQYPKIFDACWSSSPDPVDFRKFTKINLYDDKNMFYDVEGSQQLFGTVQGRFPWVTVKNCYQMERVVYRGEQMRSFDAVFSKKGIDGMPGSICNSITGEIDAEVFSNWKKYDIALYLRDNWESIKSELDGKIRISVGTHDNLLLNFAVQSLEGQMEELKSGFQFSYYPGGHFTVSTPDYRKDGYQFLKEKYLAWLSKSDSEKK